MRQMEIAIDHDRQTSGSAPTRKMTSSSSTRQGKVIAKLGDFNGFNRTVWHAAFCFRRALHSRSTAKTLYVSNLTLFLPFARCIAGGRFGVDAAGQALHGVQDPGRDSRTRA